MRQLLLSIACVLTLYGCSDDSTTADTGAADTGAADTGSAADTGTADTGTDTAVADGSITDAAADGGDTGDAAACLTELEPCRDGTCCEGLRCLCAGAMCACVE